MANLHILHICAWCGGRPLHIAIFDVPPDARGRRQTIRYGLCGDCLQTHLIDQGWTENPDDFCSSNPRAKYLKGPSVEYYALRDHSIDLTHNPF